MCGVAGWIGFASVEDPTIAAVEAALHHRGPDGTSSKRFADAGLIHTRLKIIDLSPLGDQPLANEDGSIWVAFNGEIYNHHALRRSLERQGHRFRGSADTEVLPHLYEEHGIDMFGELRGMFAVAILDLPQRRLLLARDRFGIKPLFFAHTPEIAYFASEIPALRRFPGIDLTPDDQAIADYAALRYVPGPQTLFKGITALEPGCVAELRLERGDVAFRPTRFHAFRQVVDESLDLTAAADTADALVDQAVKRQLESDVPLGAMLSGGIDSSLISAAAQRGLSQRLLTFNVRPSDPRDDETAAATAVASHLRTQHETVDMEPGAADWVAFVTFMRRLGQPLADPSVFAVSEVSAAMRRHVTVALSGDGGDELFGGYDLYTRLQTIARLRRFPAIAWRGAAAVTRPLASMGALRTTVPQRLGDLAGADDTAVVQALFSTLQERELATLLNDPGATQPLRRHFERSWDVSAAPTGALERLCAHAVEINVRVLLANSFLFKVDAGSMQNSLEIRVPLLDEDIADFGLSLPYPLRVDGHLGKRVLREVARRHIPPAIAAREKRGFTVPFDRWTDDAFRASARETLLDPNSPVAHSFDRSVFAPWVEAFVEQRQPPGLTRLQLNERMMMMLGLDACLRA